MSMSVSGKVREGEKIGKKKERVEGVEPKIQRKRSCEDLLRTAKLFFTLIISIVL